MNIKALSENGLFSVGSILLLITIYACSALTLLFYSSGAISFFGIGALTIPSLGLFLIICVLAIWKRNYYFLFLVFIILAFPAPIDDLFPSVPLTNLDDRRQVVFPLITRIDIYLILGIVLGILKNPIKLKTINYPLSLKVFFMFFVFVFVMNVIKSADLWDFNLLLAYSFHIRYFILFLILLQLYNIKKYHKQIVIGFVISLFFLLIEAYLNTYMRGSSRLLSGSLSLNTFANISAAIALYVIFLIKHKQIRKSWSIPTLAIALVILLGSGTRGAFLTLVLAYFIIFLLENHRKVVINLIKVIAGVFLVGGIYLYASGNGYIPDRYSYQEISKKIDFDFSKSGLNRIVSIKSSKETNSIKSRIDLFDTSLNMVVRNPVTGIGVGRWNRYKNIYSEQKTIPKVLLDTHNDYLALISQYGIFLGILFAWLVFYYPFLIRVKEKDKQDDNPLNYLFVINVAMGIAAISNAGFFKHQVSAVLLLCLCIMIKLKTENGKVDGTY